MTALLSPEVYDRAERAGAARLPNRIVECSQPVGFQHEGYPTRIQSLEAVGRYVDVMHEGRLVATFDDILGGGISAEELALCREVARLVRGISGTHYGRPMVPKDALARALNVYRHVRFVHPEGKAVVLEVGGGSGYLGALLSLAGYRYVATDIAQAFYLFQSHLMHAVSPGKVIELAEDPRTFADVKEIPEGWAVHVPWWKYVLPEPEFPLAVDVVTANHCLCEMHPRALAYTLRTSALLLGNRSQESCFLFEGWGSTTRNPVWSVNRAFAALGFGCAHNDTLATAYVPGGGQLGKGALVLPNPRAAEPFIRKVLRKLVGAYDPANLYSPPAWSSASSPLSKRIADGRAAFAGAATHRLAEYESMLREVLGSPDIATGDEKFLRYIDTAF